jgi:hypothetical protein
MTTNRTPGPAAVIGADPRFWKHTGLPGSQSRQGQAQPVGAQVNWLSDDQWTHQRALAKA